MTILVLIVVFFSLVNQTKILRVYSFGILIIIFTTISIFLAQSPSYFETYKDSTNYKLDYWVTDFSLSWFKGIGILMMSFSANLSFFYVRSEMNLITKKRINKVIDLHLITKSIFYLAIAISGYISLGANMVPSILPLRRKKSKYKIKKKLSLLIL